MFAAILDPFHSAAKPQRCGEHKNVLRINFAAHAKAAAHMRFEKMQRRSRPAKQARQRFLVLVRHFRRAVQFQHIARRIVSADGAARLQRHAGVAANSNVYFNHGVGCSKNAGGVAKALRDNRSFA